MTPSALAVRPDIHSESLEASRSPKLSRLVGGLGYCLPPFSANCRLAVHQVLLHIGI